MSNPSNVIPLRPLITPAPVISPPTDTEIINVRKWDWEQISTQDLIYICGDQIRAGRALDVYIRNLR